MPQKKSAIKELKKTKKRHLRNLMHKKALKIEEKKIASLIENKDVDKLKAQVNGFVSKIDKAATKGLMHKNKASRRKAQIFKIINKLSAKKSAPPPPPADEVA